jgi:hypothetical protein
MYYPYPTYFSYPYYVDYQFAYDYPFAFTEPYSFRHDRLNRLAMAGKGEVDVRVKPDDARIYVDGKLVGEDGRSIRHPSRLSLPQGRHELIFYKEGYQTVVRDIDVKLGMSTRLKAKMQPGNAVLPDKLSAAKRDGEKSGFFHFHCVVC